jgi:hypothetical protein
VHPNGAIADEGVEKPGIHGEFERGCGELFGLPARAISVCRVRQTHRTSDFAAVLQPSATFSTG